MSVFSFSTYTQANSFISRNSSAVAFSQDIFTTAGAHALLIAYTATMDNEDDYLIVPHELRICCGFLVVELRDEFADLVCNQCGAIVATLPADEAATALAEICWSTGEVRMAKP
jgi:hypothetical protein